MSDVRGKTVRMDDLLWEALDAEAARTGATEAELIRRGVALYLGFAAATREAGGVTLATVLEALGPAAKR